MLKQAIFILSVWLVLCNVNLSAEDLDQQSHSNSSHTADHHFEHDDLAGNHTEEHLDDHFHQQQQQHLNGTEDHLHQDHVIDHPNPEEENKLPVIDLYGADFKERLMMFSFALVYFDRFEAGHHEAAKEFEESAVAVKKLDFHHLSVAYGRVDCTNEVTLCKEMGVTLYPAIKFFRRGDAKHVYDGPYKHDEITNYFYSQIAHKDMSHIFDDEL